jgi:RNA polymerase sigma factor (sigma-70 family)
LAIFDTSTDKPILRPILNNTARTGLNAASKHEAEIWSSLKGGDNNALSYLYTKYLRPLYNYGLKFSRDSGLIEDCIQDLFIGLWNSRTRLGDVTNVKSYLYKSLRTTLLHKLSSLSRISVEDIDSFNFVLSHKSHYITQKTNSDISDKIKEFVNRLSPKQKEAIFLIYFEELSYEEAATIMGLKIKTVYNLVHTAIAKLRENRTKLSPSIFSFIC